MVQFTADSWTLATVKLNCNLGSSSTRVDYVVNKCDFYDHLFAEIPSAFKEEIFTF